MKIESQSAHADPLAVTLLPVLLHKLNNATQVLSSMNSLLSIDGGEELFREHTAQLGSTSARVDEIGWLLAVLASASGTNLMMERREPRGLIIMGMLVSESLRRHGHPMEHRDPGNELPLLAPNPVAGIGGWELAWAVGSLLVNCALVVDEGAPVHWSHSLSAETWSLNGPGGSTLETVGEQVLSRLPGASFTVDEFSWSLSVPAAWVTTEG